MILPTASAGAISEINSYRLGAAVSDSRNGLDFLYVLKKMKRARRL